eukprot:2210132-Alexandrium_andersonii.AAC.1
MGEVRGPGLGRAEEARVRKLLDQGEPEVGQLRPTGGLPEASGLGTKLKRVPTGQVARCVLEFPSEGRRRPARFHDSDYRAGPSV